MIRRSGMWFNRSEQVSEDLLRKISMCLSIDVSEREFRNLGGGLFSVEDANYSRDSAVSLTVPNRLYANCRRKSRKKSISSFDYDYDSEAPRVTYESNPYSRYHNTYASERPVRRKHYSRNDNSHMVDIPHKRRYINFKDNQSNLNCYDRHDIVYRDYRARQHKKHLKKELHKKYGESFPALAYERANSEEAEAQNRHRYGRQYGRSNDLHGRFYDSNSDARPYDRSYWPEYQDYKPKRSRYEQRRRHRQASGYEYNSYPDYDRLQHYSRHYETQSDSNDNIPRQYFENCYVEPLRSTDFLNEDSYAKDRPETSRKKSVDFLGVDCEIPYNILKHKRKSSSCQKTVPTFPWCLSSSESLAVDIPYRQTHGFTCSNFDDEACPKRTESGSDIPFMYRESGEGSCINNANQCSCSQNPNQKRQSSIKSIPRPAGRSSESKGKYKGMSSASIRNGRSSYSKSKKTSVYPTVYRDRFSRRHVPRVSVATPGNVCEPCRIVNALESQAVLCECPSRRNSTVNDDFVSSRRSTPLAASGCEDTCECCGTVRDSMEPPAAFREFSSRRSSPLAASGCEDTCECCGSVRDSLEPPAAFSERRSRTNTPMVPHGCEVNCECCGTVRDSLEQLAAFSERRSRKTSTNWDLENSRDANRVSFSECDLDSNQESAHESISNYGSEDPVCNQRSENKARPGTINVCVSISTTGGQMKVLSPAITMGDETSKACAYGNASRNSNVARLSSDSNFFHSRLMSGSNNSLLPKPRCSKSNCGKLNRTVSIGDKKPNGKERICVRPASEGGISSNSECISGCSVKVKPPQKSALSTCECAPSTKEEEAPIQASQLMSSSLKKDKTESNLETVNCNCAKVIACEAPPVVPVGVSRVEELKKELLDALLIEQQPCQLPCLNPTPHISIFPCVPEPEPYPICPPPAAYLNCNCDPYKKFWTPL